MIKSFLSALRLLTGLTRHLSGSRDSSSGTQDTPRTSAVMVVVGGPPPSRARTLSSKCGWRNGPGMLLALRHRRRSLPVSPVQPSVRSLALLPYRSLSSFHTYDEQLSKASIFPRVSAQVREYIV